MNRITRVTCAKCDGEGRVKRAPLYRERLASETGDTCSCGVCLGRGWILVDSYEGLSTTQALERSHELRRREAYRLRTRLLLISTVSVLLGWFVLWLQWRAG